MSIEVEAKCDGCSNDIEADGYDNVFCDNCMGKMYGRLNNLGVDSEDTADDLADKIDEICDALDTDSFNCVLDKIKDLNNDPLSVAANRIIQYLNGRTNELYNLIKEFLEVESEKNRKQQQSEHVQELSTEVQV